MTRLNKIDRCLRREAMVMQLLNKHEAANPLFQYLKILPVDLNVKAQQTKFMKKLIQQQQSESVQQHLTITYSTSINILNNNKLIIPYYRAKAGVSLLFYQGFISKYLHQCETVKTFVKECQKHILEQITS